MNTVPPLSLRERRRRISVKGKLLLVLMPTTVLAELALVEALSNQRLLFVSLANESDALTIGDLVVENRVDRISTHGNVELTRDRKGLAMAKGDQGVDFHPEVIH